MRVLCCLDGSNTERLARQALSLLSAQDLRLILLYVIDSGPGQELERMRQRHLGLGQHGAERLAQTAQAEQEQAQEILTTAQATFRAQGTRTGAGEVESIMLRGRPEQEIVRLSAEQSIDLVIVCNRRVLGPDEPPHPAGPKSVGHVARFVLDHAPCPVLLLRP